MLKNTKICHVTTQASTTFAGMKEKDIIQLLKQHGNTEYTLYEIYQSLLNDCCFLETRSPEERNADKDKLQAHECMTQLIETGFFKNPDVTETERETEYSFRFKDIPAEILIYKSKERNWEQDDFFHTARIHFDCTETFIGIPLKVQRSNFINMITELVRNIPIWENELEQMNINGLGRRIEDENHQFFKEVSRLLDENDMTNDWIETFIWGGEIYINLSHGRYARIYITPEMGINRIKSFIELLKTLEQTLKQFEETYIVIKDQRIEQNGVDYTDHYTPIHFLHNTY